MPVSWGWSVTASEVGISEELWPRFNGYYEICGSTCSAWTLQSEIAGSSRPRASAVSAARKDEALNQCNHLQGKHRCGHIERQSSTSE